MSTQLNENNQNRTLTESDLKVLRLIQRDLSGSRQETAERAGMSASTLWRRINELEAQGTIRKRVALLDPVSVGIPICIFLSVNLVDHDLRTRTQFEDFVAITPEIMECFSVTGAFDYVLIVRTTSVSAFEQLLMEQILGHKAVAAASSQISLRQHKYSTELPI